MKNKTELQKVSEETMRFTRGMYKLDEVPWKHKDINCLKFKQGSKTVLSIYIYENYYDFQIIYGKSERDKFEDLRNEFPKFIQDIYDTSKTYHDGKWMMIKVDDLQTLDVVKKMIMIKKKPNRKPFPKENAVYADCGHRCDLCVHYKESTFSDEFRKEIQQRLIRVYNPPDSGDAGYWGDDMEFCDGCDAGGLDGKHDCVQMKCASARKINKCTECSEYPCENATAGWSPKIEMKHILADDVTWAILPYVDNQYGN